MAYELTGKIKKIGEQQAFPSGFYKREVVVTTEDRYPQDIKLDCLKEKADLLNSFNVGDSVKVWFDLRGREWNDRYFVDLSVWKIEALQEGAAAAAPAAAPKAQKRAAPQAVPAEEPGRYDAIQEDEEIPF